MTVSGKIINCTDKSAVTVYHECDLDDTIVGPALIEFDYTSVLVPCGFKSEILDDGLLSIKKI